MTTCRDIVSRALRMAGIVAKGRDPKAPEMTDGMFALQSTYDSMFVGGMFGRLRDVHVGEDYEAGPGQRVFASDGEVTLPAMDGYDCRSIRDLTAIEINAEGIRQTYIWDRNGWTRLDSLGETDEAPLAHRGAEGLAACVAMQIVEDYGQSPTAMMDRKAGNFRTNLRLGLGAERDIAAGVWY